MGFTYRESIYPKGQSLSNSSGGTSYFRGCLYPLVLKRKNLAFVKSVLRGIVFTHGKGTVNITDHRSCMDLFLVFYGQNFPRMVLTQRLQ